MISKKHAEDVCMAYQMGKTCRYCMKIGPDLQCVKLTKAKKEVDLAVQAVLAECLLKGLDPYDKNTVLPIGLKDNCPGFPFTRYVEQGFDKP